MQGSKIVVSLWLATAAFCLLQILFGPTGLTETARLRQQQEKLSLRLTALKDENAALTARYEALRTSAEAVRLEARSLGWFARDEIPVQTPGAAAFRLPEEGPDLRLVPPLDPSEASSSGFFRIAWPLLFVLFYSCFIVIGKIWPPQGGVPALWQGPPGNLPDRWQTGLDFFRK